LLSIVVPVLNEAESIGPLAGDIDRAMESMPHAWECIWVDDGSTDATAATLADLHHRSPRHHFVQLDRNYGQSAALAAGFSQARGGLIAMIDGDGQNPPREIPRLVDLLIENDYHMVCGYRRRRYNRVRLLSSRIANGFRNLVTHDNIRDVGCSLRVFRAECVDGVYVFRGMHRFLPTLVRVNGFDRIAQVPVDNEPRRRGRSKYGINNRLWVGLVDTLAVRWMRRRGVVPRVARTSLDAAALDAAARKVEPGPISIVPRDVPTGETDE